MLFRIASSEDPHSMNQALVTLGVLLKDSPVHYLPGSFFFQLLHVLLNELVLINKISILLSHRVDQKSSLLADSGHSVQTHISTLGRASWIQKVHLSINNQLISKI
eukprot:GFUD01114175.1.p1 GENE.GFUD01114175.1~~GFUD01114175.1.p1  ORF type:complete len:106 (-),score=4.85 GFUD01114175.1:48-365(-)